MKVISLLNLKGGVAKTFTAVNMAYELYRRGYKVLLLDNDKQTKWGIQIDARITEVTETYQKGAEEIEATFGDSLPTLVDQIRKVR